jgi:hypothetical protein
MDNKEFVPYQESLDLKELEFNELCFGHYTSVGELQTIEDYIKLGANIKQMLSKNFNSKAYMNEMCSAPIFSQAFRWFREKHKLQYWIEGNESSKGEIYYVLHGIYKLNEERNFPIGERPEFKTYEEAELACLKKLIEIVKNK